MIDDFRRADRRDLLPATAATVIAAITVAPWALGFSASHAAVAGHIAFAMAFAPIALLISALPAAAVATAAAGAWLLASPWALGYGSLGATAWSADLLAGLMLIALAVRARLLARATGLLLATGTLDHAVHRIAHEAELAADTTASPAVAPDPARPGPPAGVRRRGLGT